MANTDDSVREFEHRHARDVLVEQARHIGDRSREGSVFAGHASVEGNSAFLTLLLGLALIAAILVVLHFAI